MNYTFYPGKNNSCDETTGYIGYANILLNPGWSNLAGRDEIFETYSIIANDWSNSVVLNADLPLAPLAVTDCAGLQGFGTQFADGRLGRDVLFESTRIQGRLGHIPYDWKSLRLMVVCFDKNDTLGVASESVPSPDEFLYSHSGGHQHTQGHFSFQKEGPNHKILFDKIYDLSVMINSDALLVPNPIYFHGTVTTSVIAATPYQDVTMERPRKSLCIDELIPLNIRTRYEDDAGTAKNISRGLLVAYFLQHDYGNRIFTTSQDIPDQFFGTIVTKYRV